MYYSYFNLFKGLPFNCKFFFGLATKLFTFLNSRLHFELTFCFSSAVDIVPNRSLTLCMSSKNVGAVKY